MSKLKIIGISIGATVLLLFVVVMVWQVSSLKRQNTELINQIGVSQQKITDSVRRAETKIVEGSRQLEDFASSNNLDIRKIKDDIQKLGANLEAVSSTIAKTETIIKINQPSTGVSQSKNEPVKCPDNNQLIDVHGYTENVQHREIEDENKMRVADVSFDASSENPWNYTVHGIHYTINSAISRDENDSIVLHSELFAENRDKQPGDLFRITSVESNLLQIENKPEFQIWSPALYLSISSGVNFWPQVQFTAAANLDFSIMSYGSWRFVGIGAGFDGVNNTFNASFFPFAYNIADHIPIVSNIYLSPYIGINHENTIGAGIRLGVRL